MAPRLWVSHFDGGSHTTSYKSCNFWPMIGNELLAADYVS